MQETVGLYVCSRFLGSLIFSIMKILINNEFEIRNRKFYCKVQEKVTLHMERDLIAQDYVKYDPFLWNFCRKTLFFISCQVTTMLPIMQGPFRVVCWFFYVVFWILYLNISLRYCPLTLVQTLWSWEISSFLWEEPKISQECFKCRMKTAKMELL